LISQKRIEIKVVKPKNGKGIAHYKSGVFGDGAPLLAKDDDGDNQQQHQ
jgi:hypothetical protein